MHCSNVGTGQDLIALISVNALCEGDNLLWKLWMQMWQVVLTFSKSPDKASEAHEFAFPELVLQDVETSDMDERNAMLGQ